MTDHIIAFLARILLAGIRILPLTLCFRIGRALGFALWVVLPRYRRLAVQNILRAYSRDLSKSQARALAREHFSTLGANLLSAFKVSVLPKETISRIAPIEGLEHIRQAIRNGRGVILAINHIGNWELYAQLIYQVPEARFGTVYQALKNPAIDELVNRDRRRLGVQTFDRRKGFQKALALVREPGVLGVLVDQNATTGGVWTPFFGSLASTSTLAATLAARAGAVLIPAAITTTGTARWKVTVGEALPIEGLSVEAATVLLNRALEAQINSSPKDWFWVHNRWRIPHPHYLTVSQKRGTYLPPDCDPSALKPFRMVARSPNWLGDAVMAIPAIRALKFGRPDARLAVLTPAKLAPLWESVDAVDEVIAFPARENPLATARRLRNRFEAAILFPNSFRSALEAWLAGVPRRVGFRGQLRALLLNQIIKEKKRERIPRPLHHADRYASIAVRSGGRIPEPQAALWNPPEHIVIGICPGAEYGPAKRWPPEQFRSAMEILDAQIVCEWKIFGVAGDLPAAEKIASEFPGRVQNLCGRTDLAGLISELSSLHVLLTNDTGTMHLADHLGVPLVAIFGSTEPRLTGPRGPHSMVLRHQVECSPCFLRDCPLDFRCMKSVEPVMAATALKSLLTRTKARIVPRPPK